ncbi:MULE domain-containing protein, partial [Aphis craccivora]
MNKGLGLFHLVVVVTQFFLFVTMNKIEIIKTDRGGSITTDQSILNVLKNIEHENHLLSSAQVEATKAMLNMHTKAQNNFDTPSRVFAEETSNLSNEAMVLLTDEKSIKRSLRRIRNKKYPSLCPLSELKINSNWATTGGAEPKQFLLFDNENNDNRLIVFASPEGIGVWIEHFLLVLKSFIKYLYIIHACIKNTLIPCVYALLQRKNKEIYVELLSKLKSMLFELKLKTISIDFEQLMIQAIELVFVDINIQCCYYHLSQSIWRKVQNIGLTKKYKENENVRQMVGMIGKV